MIKVIYKEAANGTRVRLMNVTLKDRLIFAISTARNAQTNLARWLLKREQLCSVRRI